jgi:hypothetical protein
MLNNPFRIEPLLHQVLMIYSDTIHLTRPKEAIDPLLALRQLYGLLRSRPSSFFHDHVRHVCFLESHMDFIQTLLSKCTGTVDLLLHDVQGRQARPYLRPLLTTLRLQRLSADMRLLFPGPGLVKKKFSLPLFSELTHLDIHDWGLGGWDVWSDLAELPRLTHLSVHDGLFPSPLIMAALLGCSSLEALVNVCSNRSSLHEIISSREELATDPRFMMLVVADAVEDWERGARGGEDYWAVADAFIKDRRAGNTTGEPSS